jgi:hypothetical protein
MLLGGALEAFEQDDRAAAVRDLRQLQLAEMVAQRPKRRVQISCASGHRRLAFRPSMKPEVNEIDGAHND